MDDWTKYTAFRIPQRETRDATDKSNSASARPASPVLPDETQFAEVEFEENPNRAVFSDAASRFLSHAAKPQPIEQRATDPIRQKFFEMRSLAVDRPFARDDAELFYRQATLMEDFTDDYDGSAKFFMYYPYYQQMGYEQLRTYFTWRTKARQGEIQPISVSYVFLYVYELITGIGVRNPTEGLDKLVEIWNEFGKYDNALLNYLPLWLKDYHIYYYLQHSFTDFVKNHNLYRHYPEMFLFDANVENPFELWNSISDYNVTESTFYKAGNEQLMESCIKFVIDGIMDMCKSLKINPEDLFIYHYSRVGTWYPFKQALFYPSRSRPDRNVNMPGREHYNCKNNRWSAYVPIYYSSYKQLVGRIMKRLESCLRQTFKYKYKLKTEPSVFYRSSGTPINFDPVIEKAVADFYRDLTRTVVIVDHTNLARIREEALGTQDRLIVNDNAECRMQNAELLNGYENTVRFVGDDVLGVPPTAVYDEKPDKPPSTAYDEKPDTPTSTAYDVKPDTPPSTAYDVKPDKLPPYACDAKSDTPPSPAITDHLETPDSGSLIQETDVWSELSDALSVTERRALIIALNGGGNIKAFADENGIMLEVLADGINEKAADYIGDNILELDGGMAIYDEYRDNIARIIECI